MTNEEAIKWIERFELAFPLPIEDYIDAKEALDMAIKALEQQPCEDCISRQEALKVMCDKCPMYNCVCGCSSYRHIEKMPSVTPQQTRWIPIGERLPEEHKEVLTCNLGDFIEIQSFEDAYGGYWENQKGDWTDFDEVIAWMPLPEPYKAESEANTDDT